MRPTERLLLANFRGGESQVAVGVKKYLPVSGAIERKRERQGKLASIVVAQRDHRTALRGGGAIVAEPRISVPIAWNAAGHRRESEGCAVEVELIEFLDHAIAVFDNRHISDVAIGGSDGCGRERPESRSPRPLGLAMQEHHLGRSRIAGAAACRLVTRHKRRGTDRNRKTNEPEAKHKESTLILTRSGTRHRFTQVYRRRAAASRNFSRLAPSYPVRADGGRKKRRSTAKSRACRRPACR